MRIAIVGRGLIGSAAARHLALAGHDVVLIGPDEPTDFARHTGVFASHYDEGRITRGLDPSPFWSEVSRASIARYRDIEAASGVAFFKEVGAMLAGPADGDFIRQTEEVMQAAGAQAMRFDGPEITAKFGYFRFPNTDRAYYEAKAAGHISPRSLVKAQNNAGARAGVEIIRQEARAIDAQSGGASVRLADGLVEADQVLVTAGGFSNALLNDVLPLKVYARTVALFEVNEEVAQSLSGMPSLVYRYANGDDPYLLPAIRYPDGKPYLKIGGDTVDVVLESDADTRDWFRSGGSKEVGEMLTDRIRDRMPGLAIQSIQIKPCVTVFTPTDLPIIDRLGPTLSVAAGACGRGAKCSDELGRLAGETVLGQGDPRTQLVG